MALLWRKTCEDTDYEVRSAGRTRRLYTNGVFHSQYSPARPWTHGVWDLLMLPALFHSPGEIQRVLVLGVGGGAVIRLLQSHIRPREIIGIDLNPVHLSVARRFFGVRTSSAELIPADACHWLANYRGPPFDLIIEDLFGDADGQPRRAVPLDAGWCALLKRHLSRRGTLVVNTLGQGELRRSTLCTRWRTARGFRRAWRLDLPVYDNVVGAFLRVDAERHTLYKALEALPRTPGRKLDFRLRRLALPERG